jgi:hypothetical protein
MHCHGRHGTGSAVETDTTLGCVVVSERFLVTGGNRLVGDVVVGGAKNSVLKLMAAALLAEGTTTITNCPDILDVPLMAEVLRGLGCEVELDGDEVRITTPAQPSTDGFGVSATAAFGLGGTVGFARDEDHTAFTVGIAEGYGLFGSAGEEDAPETAVSAQSAVMAGLGPISGQLEVRAFHGPAWDGRSAAVS